MDPYVIKHDDIMVKKVEENIIVTICVLFPISPLYKSQNQSVTKI